jgi:hypothetical protein
VAKTCARFACTQRQGKKWDPSLPCCAAWCAHDASKPGPGGCSGRERWRGCWTNRHQHYRAAQPRDQTSPRYQWPENEERPCRPTAKSTGSSHARRAHDTKRHRFSGRQERGTPSGPATGPFPSAPESEFSSEHRLCGRWHQVGPSGHDEPSSHQRNRHNAVGGRSWNRPGCPKELGDGQRHQPPAEAVRMSDG